MAKAMDAHSSLKSIMAMAIVAIPMAPAMLLWQSQDMPCFLPSQILCKMTKRCFSFCVEFVL